MFIKLFIEGIFIRLRVELCSLSPPKTSPRRQRQTLERTNQKDKKHNTTKKTKLCVQQV